MSSRVLTQRVEVPPRWKARLAGALYLFSLVIAATTETFLHGSLNIAAGFVAIAGMVGLTLLFYEIFKPVSKDLSLLAAFLNLVGLSFEALRLQPHGLNIALVFTGFYCLVIGYLIFKSTFLPRVLGALMAFAGLGWLMYLSNPLVHYLSPYNLAAGLCGEVSVMLWLLVMSVNGRPRQEQARAAGETVLQITGKEKRS
jgi:Domain of unknown function (DUF4386)